MKAQLRAIPKEDTAYVSLHSKSMQEITGRNDLIKPVLTPPVFEDKLIDFTKKKWTLNSLFLLKK